LGAKTQELRRNPPNQPAHQLNELFAVMMLLAFDIASKLSIERLAPGGFRIMQGAGQGM